MGTTAIITILLIVVTLIVSYQGLNKHSFLERYAFEVDKVLLQKDYKRLITSGFLHVSWWHLGLNLLTLYFFGSVLEPALGPLRFLLIYFGSMLGGNLFALLIHKQHGDYSAIGASGAVCGVTFACIAIFPGFYINLFFFPMAGWLYGVLYVLATIYGIRNKRDNIGHEAHLGGALLGMIISIIMVPSSLSNNLFPIVLITIPCIIFIFIIVTRPHFLLVNNNFFKKHPKYYSIEHKYNLEKADKQKMVDDILDKIRRRGMESLSKKEREILDEYSRTLR